MPYPKQPEPPVVLINPGMGWTRFTYSRADMELLGVIQFGMQIGALARLASGDYAQVNGDFVELLDGKQVATALSRMGLLDRASPIAANAAPASQPVVTIKKRRRIAMPGEQLAG